MILEFMQRTQSSEDPDPIVISFKELYDSQLTFLEAQNLGSNL